MKVGLGTRNVSFGKDSNHSLAVVSSNICFFSFKYDVATCIRAKYNHRHSKFFFNIRNILNFLNDDKDI